MTKILLREIVLVWVLEQWFFFLFFYCPQTIAYPFKLSAFFALFKNMNWS